MFLLDSHPQHIPCEDLPALTCLCSELVRVVKILVLFGAGASNAAGVPDFASAGAVIGGKYATWFYS
jgi:hypothetical protein